MPELNPWRDLLHSLRESADRMRNGGGARAIERQHSKGRLTARERVDLLLDAESQLFEIGLFSGYGLYQEWGGAPGAGLVTGIGWVHDRPFIIVANDATVKAGAFFPSTTKKLLRAQRIAFDNRIPLVYLVDSAGVFLPLQDEVFPDQDDFGRIFRNNARISAAGIAQIAAIMGPCVAGGAYLPVMSDKILMTEGSGLYIAGPALVQAAIGQRIESDELGGAKLHSRLSGTIDFREEDDKACLARLRSLISEMGEPDPMRLKRDSPEPPVLDSKQLYQLHPEPGDVWQTEDVLQWLVDANSAHGLHENPHLAWAKGRIEGWHLGLVLVQQQTALEPGEFQHLIQFVRECEADHTPMVLVQNCGPQRPSPNSDWLTQQAVLIEVFEQTRVPKLALVMNGPIGPGVGFPCGKSFQPRLILSWPTAHFAENLPSEENTELAPWVERLKTETSDPVSIYRASAHLWVDRIIEPHETREALALALEVTSHNPDHPGMTL